MRVQAAILNDFYYTTNGTIVNYFLPDVLSVNDYYSFGSSKPGRNFNSNTYKYGFNGKEKESEINTGAYDFGARVLDSRLARFFSPDPLIKGFPMLTPFCFAANQPIRCIDLDGKGPLDRIKKAEEIKQTNPTYSQKTGENRGLELRSGTSEKALKYIDCSELVCRVLATDNVTPKVEVWTTYDMVGKFENTDEFHKSNSPTEGAIFLWGYYEKNSKGVNEWHGHTGIVKSFDSETGKVVIIHAKGTNYGVKEEEYDIGYFTGHKGWKGFYTPAKDIAEDIDNTIKEYTELANKTFEALDNFEKGSEVYNFLMETMNFYLEKVKEYSAEKIKNENQK